MKTKRNILALVLAVAAAFLLTACSVESGPESSASAPAPEESVSAENERETASVDSQPEATPTPSEQEQGGAVLVAYFSHTGNTEAVAQQIAGLTGGTLAEILRAEAYQDLQEEAEAEILQGVHPDITVSVDNVEDYDTIFVGYPKME